MQPVFIFFFNDTATTEIYTLSLHDALPIYQHPPGDDRVVSHALLDLRVRGSGNHVPHPHRGRHVERRPVHGLDRKSTRLNSSHANISYAVFCLKKKKNNISSALYCLHNYMS